MQMFFPVKICKQTKNYTNTFTGPIKRRQTETGSTGIILELID